MSIGQIVVDLIAKTGTFNSDLDRSAKLADKKAKEIDAAFAKIGAGIATGVMAVGGAVLALAKSTATAADQINRFSALTNSGTTEFQRMAAGARAVGVDQEKLADILKDTQDKLGDFITTGKGPLADFFDSVGKKIGVTIKDFQDLSGPQALQLFASSLEKAGVSGQQATFFMESLASDASLLLPVLADGGRRMGELADEAQALGVILDEKTIAAAVKTERAMDRVGQQVQGLGRQIAADVMPAIAALTDELLKTPQGGDAVRSMSKIAGDGLRALMVVGVGTAGVFEALGATIGGVAAGLKLLFSGELKAAKAAVGLMLDDIEAIQKKSLDRMNLVWSPPELPDAPVVVTGGVGGRPPVAVPPKKTGKTEAEKMAERLRDTMDSLSKRVSTLGMDEKGIALFDAKKLGASADQLRQIGDAFDVINTYTALAKDNADAEAALKKLKDEAKTLTESLRTPYEAWIDSLDDLDKKLDAGLITYETYVRAINLEGEKLSASVQEATDQAGEFALEAARSIQSTLGDGLVNVLSGNFKSIGESFKQMLLRMAADAAAAQLSKYLFGDFDKTGNVGGLLGRGLTSIARLFNPTGGMADARTMPGLYATGGPVAARDPIIVGEQGPELFVPNTAGKILPNSAFGSGGQGVTIHSSLSVAPGVTAAQFQAAMDQRDARLKAELVDGMRRGRYAIA